MGLLDYLVRETSAGYISDLRFRLSECARALQAIEDFESFSLEEWNRAGTYLSPVYEPQTTHAAARDVVLGALAGPDAPAC